MRPVIAALEGQCELFKCDLWGQEAWLACQTVGGFLRHEPHIILLLGDRFEILAAALTATVARIPIAHIHGGESSYGSFDNQIRDAVTKLAHIHFVAAEPFQDRLLYLQEERGRIHVVGAPGLDNLVDLPPRKPEKYFVVTYHPETLGDDSGVDALIEALGMFPDYKVIWTGVNADPGGEEIRRKFAKRFMRHDLALDVYLKFARNAAVLIGNSSSGIIEGPSLGVPTVNIGPRQDGRLKAKSIVDCPNRYVGANEIVRAISHAIVHTSIAPNPYGGPGASAKIADILSTIDLDGVLVKR